jgi:succinate dehydrogenase hydrophobic anchor subunit
MYDVSVWKEESAMAISTLLLVILVIFLIGAVPAWPYSRSWGYYPSGFFGLLLLIVLLLFLTGHI